MKVREELSTESYFFVPGPESREIAGPAGPAFSRYGPLTLALQFCAILLPN